MKIYTKNKIFILHFLLMLLLFMVYFRALIIAFLGDKVNYIYIFLFLCIWLYAIVYGKFFVFSKYKIKLMGIWLFFTSYFILNRYQGTEIFSFATLVTGGSIITAYALFDVEDDWENFFKKVTIFCIKIHSIATIVFGIFPSLYFSTIYKLFDVSTKNIIYQQINNGCVTGLTNHYSENGIYLGIGVMILGVEVIMSKEKNNNIKKVWFFLTCISLLLTGKRAQLLFSILALVFMWLICSKQKSGSKIIKIMGLIILGLVLITLIINFIPSLSTTLQRLLSIFDSSDITNGRLYFYEYAILWFLEKPILGIGWEGFKYRLNAVAGAYVGQYTYMSAHNVYLQVACELGIFGLIIFISKIFQDLYLIIRKVSWRTIPDCDDLIHMEYGTCIFLFFIMYCITGNPLYDIEIFFPFICAMVAFYRALRRIEKGNS